MKKLKKLLAGVLTLAMAMSMMTMTAFATEITPSTFDDRTTGSLTVHKRGIDADSLQDYLETVDHGNGEELPANSEVFTKTKPLPGVEFTVYQVEGTDWLNTYYGAGTATMPVVGNYLNGDGTFNSNKLLAGGTQKAVTTDANGEASFTDLPLGLYVVVETKKTDEITQKVAPFLVSIPMTKTNGSGWLYNVHVYPKNGTNAAGMLTLIKKGKTVGGTDAAVALENVTFTLQKLNGTTWEDYKYLNLNGKETNEEKEAKKINLTTDGSGQITIEGLPDGDYRFIETKIGSNVTGEGTDANAGYIRDGLTTYDFKIEDGKFKNGPTTAEEVVIPEDGGSLTFTVVNEKPLFDKETKSIDAEGNETFGDVADYSVGDQVPFKISVGIPSNVANMKTFIVHDKLENMELYGSITAQVDGVDIGFAQSGSKTEFDLKFTGASLADYAGDVMIIEYEATLLNSAATAAGVTSKNNAKLEYSHNIRPNGEPGDDDKDVIEDTSYVDSYKIKVTKTFSPALPEDTELEGKVVFELEKKEGDNWVKLPGEIKVDSQGIATKGGLSNGEYRLVETKTIDGYNLLKDPIDVTLQFVASTSTKTTTTVTKDADGNIISSTTTKEVTVDSHSGGNDTIDGTWGESIVNKKGFELPETGGMGTFVFTFVGVAMMAAAVILFITSKKKTVK